MKNALLALALFAFVGTATAHEGKDEKKSKKSAAKTCNMPEKGTAACCMKKDTKTAAVKAAPAPAAAPVTKSL
ncbi:hypothetical protein H8B13_03285 [Hymenobacter sp. BT188]|uniref:hypothetical protein n=1 Tax=unclassified Hymenobacter TaxID=2615202 RepID=UPI00140BB19D|nr:MULTISPECIES: hypothetical protein [unclassified Hymenobacter]MBC6605832.1 hypothetical protein [Hymenobacter sp. BT188]QIL74934.1 hypothetical protein G7064_02960 [Hymenobacter sp. HDW8]